MAKTLMIEVGSWLLRTLELKPAAPNRRQNAGLLTRRWFLTRMVIIISCFLICRPDALDYRGFVGGAWPRSET